MPTTTATRLRVGAVAKLRMGTGRTSMEDWRLCSTSPRARISAWTVVRTCSAGTRKIRHGLPGVVTRVVTPKAIKIITVAIFAA